MTRIVLPHEVADNSLYRAVWRWHFYAGLFVLPFLIWMATTGALYLYKPELERFVYRDWLALESPGPVLPLGTMVASVQDRSGGRVTQIVRPGAVNESWRMALELPSGAKRLAFVDPRDGAIRGTTHAGGVLQTVRDLHSLVITGPVGNAVVEIVAGWAILLVVSGAFLWWPRHGSPVIGIRAPPRSRLFWRDFHASTGAAAGAVILFLAVTGMPWSGIWGKALQGQVAERGLGRPRAPGPAPWEQPSAGHAHGEARASLPWAMQEMPEPASAGAGDVGPDRVAAVAAARGLRGPWTITLPAGPGLPYLVSAAPGRAEEAHVVYVEASTGKVLQDARYRQFGPGARVIEWGIATHQGLEYGEPNRLLMLFGCLAVVGLAVSAPVMWWKRRRYGRLALPPAAADPRPTRGALAVMLALGALFPLTGATMLVMLAGDRLWARSARATG